MWGAKEDVTQEATDVGADGMGNVGEFSADGMGNVGEFSRLDQVTVKLVVPCIVIMNV